MISSSSVRDDSSTTPTRASCFFSPARHISQSIARSRAIGRHDSPELLKSRADSSAPSSQAEAMTCAQIAGVAEPCSLGAKGSVGKPFCSSSSVLSANSRTYEANQAPLASCCTCRLDVFGESLSLSPGDLRLRPSRTRSRCDATSGGCLRRALGCADQRRRGLERKGRAPHAGAGGCAPSPNAACCPARGGGTRAAGSAPPKAGASRAPARAAGVQRERPCRAPRGTAQPCRSPFPAACAASSCAPCPS
eukprot:scaffold166938_cov27-Tisochrysis_lutea.AAC.1